jgi:ArsR family transcriptional regulator, arsenate/arsenite/antimonite-responsive transcriptional repressor
MVDVITIQERTLGSRCCNPDLQAELSPNEAQSLSEAMQLLGHPVRLQILDVLARHAGQVCVCDLEAAVPVKQPTVSHHLRLLREAGLVDCERHGQWAYYFVQRERLAAIRAQVGGWLATLA